MWVTAHPYYTGRMPTPRNARDAAAGALLGTFVGDALGMPFEGRPAAAVPARPEMEEARLGRGTYTDDTQMMIALAESLLEQGEMDDPHLARAYLEAFDPERGYGSGTIDLFALWRQGVPLTEAAGRLYGGEGSLGNGAAMRIAPLAVRFAECSERLRVQAEQSARLTDAHPLAIDAAVVQAAAIAAALRGEEILAAARNAPKRRSCATSSPRLRNCWAPHPRPKRPAHSSATRPRATAPCPPRSWPRSYSHASTEP
jgi:ADP-ribosylglycohydrolase